MKRWIAIIAGLAFVALVILVIRFARPQKMAPPGQCPQGHSSFEENVLTRSYVNTNRLVITLNETFNPPGVFYTCRVCGYRMFEDGTRWRHAPDPTSFKPSIPEFAVFHIEEAEISYTRQMRFDEITSDHVCVGSEDPKAAEEIVLSALGRRGVSGFIRSKDGNDTVAEAEHQGYKVTVKTIGGFKKVYIEIEYPEPEE